MKLLALALLWGMMQKPDPTCTPYIPDHPLIGACYHNVKEGTEFVWTGMAWAGMRLQFIEPLDVPAVQEIRTVSLPDNFSKEGTNGRECSWVGIEGMSRECKFDIKVWTCSDKTRILEHDEQTPPKYWCRKPQP